MLSIINVSRRMNILRKMCIAFLAVSVLFTAGGCKSKKDLPAGQGGTRISMPLSGDQYRADANHFRAVNSGSSVDYAMARRIALQNARVELAQSIEATMKVVGEQYADQRQVGNRQEFQTRFEEMSRTVANQVLNDVRTIGEETYRESDGRTTVWIAIEMSKTALADALNNSISRDERLRLDFDQQRFRQVFDEEMKKFEQNR